MGHGMPRGDRSHQDGTQGLGMEHEATGWDTRWDMGHWEGMGQEPLVRDTRQDRRSQEDMENQDGTGGPGIGHKRTEGTWDNEDGMNWDGT